MLSKFKNHPFGVEAFFKRSVVLTFAVPKEQLAPLIPECLALDTYKNKWAFIAVAMVDTTKLRPKGFPEFLGNNFILMGYRIFVKYTTSYKKRLRGLYILKSETNKKQMAFMGNLFTHYNYTSTDVCFDKETIISNTSKLNISYNSQLKDTEIPTESPFLNWKEARRFSGPLPFTFTYNEATKEVLIIEGVRKNWRPKPIKIIDYNIDFLKSLNTNTIKLASAFTIENIPYYWKKGKIDLWKQTENNFRAY